MVLIEASIASFYLHAKSHFVFFDELPIFHLPAVNRRTNLHDNVNNVHRRSILTNVLSYADSSSRIRDNMVLGKRFCMLRLPPKNKRWVGMSVSSAGTDLDSNACFEK